MHFIGIGVEDGVAAEVLIYSVYNSINGLIKMKEIGN